MILEKAWLLKLVNRCSYSLSCFEKKEKDDRADKGRGISELLWWWPLNNLYQPELEDTRKNGDVRDNLGLTEPGAGCCSNLICSSVDVLYTWSHPYLSTTLVQQAESNIPCHMVLKRQIRSASLLTRVFIPKSSSVTSWPAESADRHKNQHWQRVRMVHRSLGLEDYIGIIHPNGGGRRGSYHRSQR